MAKIMIADLAKVLIEKHGVSQTTAQLFLTSIVECIQDGIADDNIVKIKGLGTFKLVDVDARESVDVNSGERVLIDSHSKLTFVPDSTMKELVNKPFSQFETVVLNDGVDADTLARAAEIAASQENMEPDLQDEQEAETEEEQNNEETSTPDDKKASEGGVAADDSSAGSAVEEVAVTDASANDDSEEEDNMKDTVPYSGDEDYFKDERIMKEKEENYRWAWIFLAVAACVASFAGGYIFGTQKRNVEVVEATILPATEQEDSDSVAKVQQEPQKPEQSQEPQKKQETKKPDQPQEPQKTQQPQKTQEAQKPQLSQEPQKPQQPQKSQEPQQPQQPQKTQEPQKPQSSQQPAANWQKYDEMDKRLSHGAYGIVGTDREITVKEGQTISSITRGTLGPGMECYVEVYNGLKANEKLKAGQKVKIPKVELKRKLKQNTNNQ